MRTSLLVALLAGLAGAAPGCGGAAEGPSDAGRAIVDGGWTCPTDPPVGRCEELPPATSCWYQHGPCQLSCGCTSSGEWSCRRHCPQPSPTCSASPAPGGSCGAP